jgi:soluble lytic murein transglycosylase-like protein
MSEGYLTIMFRRSSLGSSFSLLLSIGAASLFAVPAHAENDDAALAIVPARSDVPVTGEGSFAAAIAAIRSSRWDAARAQIDSMRDRQLAAFARAELYLAPQSPRVEGEQLRALLAEAPNLPQATRLATLARRRGITELPALPSEQRLLWAGSAPRRGNPRTVSDTAVGLVRQSIQDRITNDDPAGAESILTGVMNNMSPESRTEWQYRVAWSYYIENDDANARRMASIAQAGVGEWASQADWAQGLASWRQNDCRAAMAAFRNVAGRSSESEMEAAGNFWFARAAVACGEPAQAQPALRRAARLDETFYGQLASEALGITPNVEQESPSDSARRRISSLPNVRTAQALAAAGESQLADQALRFQARIGPAQDHAALAQLAGTLNLPETQLYLAHNAPQGVRPATGSRYPTPQWAPSDGWRINPALLFAHTLQESQFRTRVVSPAGAVGLMQLRPGTAGDMGLRQRGGDLTNPATNMALGQSYIEYLRDSGITGGLLPKVIAAYNAGPAPVQRWNSEVRDNGDPLLFIESIPYWETRAYVGTVLRNLWIYETEMGTRTDSRALLAQGRWPRVPEAPRRLASRGGN